jgi:hypothetical protein
MFVLAIILAIITAIATAAAVIGRNGPAVLIAGAGAILTVICFVVASLSIVPTRNVGIVTQFGKPTGRTTGAGLQWTAPWQDVQDWDATRQSYNHLGDKCDHPGDGSLWVQIAGQRNMCVRVQINWETTDTNQASKNWATYREVNGESRFDVFVDRQVHPLINDAVLATFRDFDPLALVDPNTGEAKAPDLSNMYTPVLRMAIQQRLGQDITVMSISWGLPGYDAATTALISQYGQKVLEKRNLNVDKQNAVTRESIAKQSGVPAAVQQCLDLIKTLGKGEPGLCMGGNVALTRSVQ